MKNLVIGFRSGKVETIKDVKGRINDLVDMISFTGDSSAYLNIRRNTDEDVCMMTFVKDVEFIKLEEKKDEYRYYTHIAYADSEDGRKGFTLSTRGTERYVGVAYNKTSPEPIYKPEQYHWFEIKR